MTLFPNRYRIRIVGADGLVHTQHSDHPLLISVDEFLLRKKIKTGVAGVSYFDTKLNRPLHQDEVHPEELEAA